MIDHLATKLLVRNILRHPHHHEWSLQGFGMLRTYLDDQRVFRLHIWSQEHAVENVSLMHNHPWDFTSKIIAGEITNRRFTESEDGQPFTRSRILCGEGGCIKSEPERVLLAAWPPERYIEGDSYKQTATEIHSSHPADGTVTLIERVFGEDNDHADVYYKEGEIWVSAEPRTASEAEIKAICNKSLRLWF